MSVAQTGSAINTARTARSAGAFSSGATTARSEGPHSMMDETADMIRQAEHIIGDDASMTGDINRYVTCVVCLSHYTHHNTPLIKFLRS